MGSLELTWVDLGWIGEMAKVVVVRCRLVFGGSRVLKDVIVIIKIGIGIVVQPWIWMTLLRLWRERHHFTSTNPLRTFKYHRSHNAITTSI